MRPGRRGSGESYLLGERMRALFLAGQSADPWVALRRALKVAGVVFVHRPIAVRLAKMAAHKEQ